MFLIEFIASSAALLASFLFLFHFSSKEKAISLFHVIWEILFGTEREREREKERRFSRSGD